MVVVGLPKRIQTPDQATPLYGGSHELIPLVVPCAIFLRPRITTIGTLVGSQWSCTRVLTYLHSVYDHRPERDATSARTDKRGILIELVR